MKKILSALVGLAAVAGAVAAVGRYLKQKGIVQVEVNFEDENGDNVSENKINISGDGDSLEKKAMDAFDKVKKPVVEFVEPIIDNVGEKASKAAKAVKDRTDEFVREFSDKVDEASKNAGKMFDKAEEKAADFASEIKEKGFNVSSDVSGEHTEPYFGFEPKTK
ncbi:MAG: hypothetical protein RR058_05370 [Oscillospiraceae bacterium]